MATNQRSVTNRSAFNHRSLGKQVLFSIITFGLYPLYWMHTLHQQLDAGTNADISVTMRTIGLLIPVYNFYAIWQTSHDAEPVADQDGVMLFVLFIVFSPAAWYLIQSGINSIAEQ